MLQTQAPHLQDFPSGRWWIHTVHGRWGDSTIHKLWVQLGRNLCQKNSTLHLKILYWNKTIGRTGITNVYHDYKFIPYNHLPISKSLRVCFSFIMWCDLTGLIIIIVVVRRFFIGIPQLAKLTWNLWLKLWNIS